MSWGSARDFDHPDGTIRALPRVEGKRVAEIVIISKKGNPATVKRLTDDVKRQFEGKSFREWLK